MSVTEVGVMGIKPGRDVMNDDTPEGQTLTGIWKTVTTAPGGPQNVHWGIESEDPSKIWCFFDWNSVEEHQKFAKLVGEGAVKDLPSIMTHGEFTKHVTLAPSSLALQSRVTDAVVLFFPSDIPPAVKSSATTQVQQFIEKSQYGTTDVEATSYGWGVENDFPVRGEGGRKGSILTAFIGFPSKDAHAKFRETVAYKENIDDMKAIEGLLRLLVFDMACKSLLRTQG